MADQKQGLLYPEQENQLPAGLQGLLPPDPRDHAIKRKFANDTNMLARLIISEAGGEKSAEELQIIANVVGNRILDNATNFRKQGDYSSVISARLPSDEGYEFTGFANEAYKDAHNHDKWEQAKRLANLQVSGKLPDITGGSTFYRNENRTKGAGQTSYGHKFFEDAVASGRFNTFKKIGNHTLYQDSHSSTHPRFDKKLGYAPPEDTP
tara:strand:+ start:61 stop:687 length:627 start_codon:yes stop_codon:yes gene_type:complete